MGVCKTCLSLDKAVGGAVEGNLTMWLSGRQMHTSHQMWGVAPSGSWTPMNSPAHLYAYAKRHAMVTVPVVPAHDPFANNPPFDAEVVGGASYGRLVNEWANEWPDSPIGEEDDQ